MRIAIVGFGHVGRALAKLLVAERDRLPVTVTAIVTAGHGSVVEPRGLDLERALADGAFGSPRPAIGGLPADAVVELTPLDVETGGPGLTHVREALGAGRHVVTANKGPIALAFRELSALAAAHGVVLRFEAAVADCLPVFDLARTALPLADISAIRGVVSSTANHVLSAAARGVTVAAALAEAQRLGIAEADPRQDLEGWDSAAKAAILATVLMGAELRPSEVRRAVIDERAARSARDAAARGDRVRPVIELTRVPGGVRAAFGPRRLDPLDPLHAVEGTSLGLVLDTDLAGRIAVQLHAPGVAQTAYAILTDLLEIAAMRP